MKKFFAGILAVVLIIIAFSAGVYLSPSVYKALSSFDKNLKNFERTDIGNLVQQAAKEVFNPAPLKVKNPFVNVTLVSQKIATETNLQRNLNGNLPPLYKNDVLDQAALAKANDMFKNQYFEHVSPAGVAPSDLVKSFGYNYIVTGENLILGNFASEKELVQAWMESPGHKANILNNRYAEIGVAIVKGTWKGETTWIGVQEFGLPLSACTQPDVGLKDQIGVLRVQLDDLSAKIDQRRQEINAAASDTQKYNSLVPGYNDLVKQYEDMAANIKNLIAKYNNQVAVFNKCVAGSNQ